MILHIILILLSIAGVDAQAGDTSSYTQPTTTRITLSTETSSSYGITSDELMTSDFKTTTDNPTTTLFTATDSQVTTAISNHSNKTSDPTTSVTTADAISKDPNSTFPTTQLPLSTSRNTSDPSEGDSFSTHAPTTDADDEVSTLGPRRTSSTQASPRTTTDRGHPPSVGDGALVAIAVVAVLLFILVILGFLYLLYIRFNAQVQRMPTDSDAEDPEEANPTRFTKKRKLPSLASLRHKTRRFSKPPPVPLKNFIDRVEILHRDSDFFFASEYEMIKNCSPSHPQNAGQVTENRVKNRYANILPFDHSRVKLLPTDEDEQGSDYINANYIPGYNSKREFIATQGPHPLTLDDFWRMIWEQNVTMIVMVTNLEEHTKVKCCCYWPTDAEPVFRGDLQIQLRSESVHDNYVIRVFDVKLGMKERVVKQMHFVRWPDFGCPERTKDLIDFNMAVRSHQDHEIQGPLVIHCSAGVGRTGTFIAIDTLIQHIKEHDTVDIFGLTLQMRDHRPNMVQAESQYIFIHDCLRDILLAQRDEDDEGSDEDEGEDNQAPIGKGEIVAENGSPGKEAGFKVTEEKDVTTEL